MRTMYTCMRWATAVLAGGLLFVSENDLDDVATNLCDAYQKAFDDVPCPELIGDPNWALFFKIFLLVVSLIAAWPVFGWLLRHLLQAYNLLSSWSKDQWLSISRRLRAVTLTAIEEATGKQIHIGEKDAKNVVRNSKIGRNAYKGGQTMESQGLGSLLSSVGNFGVAPPSYAAIQEQYNGWLELALETFREDSRLLHDGADMARFYRQSENGEFEYSEKELRKWLEQRWAAKVTNRFGDI